MKRWKSGIIALAFVVGVGIFLPQTAFAVEVFEECANNQDAAVCDGTSDTATNMMGIIINTLLYVIGIIAVIMIVVGGIRYSLSGGNASQVKEAKDTILYAVIGLVVAIMAFAIVNFVLDWF
ncbi:MAG TPA: pilin [Candidatus Saccharimonadales bacterium]|nr:pilin [Candidatus Saccharimonadales bacterium]